MLEVGGIQSNVATPDVLLGGVLPCDEPEDDVPPEVLTGTEGAPPFCVLPEDAVVVEPVLPDGVVTAVGGTELEVAGGGTRSMVPELEGAEEPVWETTAPPAAAELADPEEPPPHAASASMNAPSTR